MAKLEIKANKRLTLKKVLCYEIKDGNIENMEKELKKFITFLSVSTIKTIGPLITYSGEMKIDAETGTITNDFSIMVQLTTEYPNHPDYKYYEKISIANCLYIRFDGLNEELSYATSKLDLYIYENELTRKGGLYQVLIYQNEEIIKTDYFQPIEEVLDAI